MIRSIMMMARYSHAGAPGPGWVPTVTARPTGRAKQLTMLRVPQSAAPDDGSSGEAGTVSRVASDIERETFMVPFLLRLA